LLITDGSNSSSGQRSRSRQLLPPDALQPFLCRCGHLKDLDMAANRTAILVDIGIDRLRRLATAAVENGLSGLTAVVPRSRPSNA
jgi:hypothetical protein